MPSKRTIIHLDNKTKSQLADRLPETAKSMLKEEPEEMDLGIFLDHIGLYEKLVRKLEGKAKMVWARYLPFPFFWSFHSHWQYYFGLD